GKRRSRRKYCRVALGACVGLQLLGGLLGVRQVRERLLTPPAAEDVGPTTGAQEQALAVPEKAVTAPVREKPERPELPPSSAGSSDTGQDRMQEVGAGTRENERNTASPAMNTQSRVETAMALGLQGSGPGRGDPAPSLAALQAAVETDRADLQALYERERATNPTLLGSVVLNFIIEPNGRVSRARVQAAKLPNPRMQERVLALARTWQFAPAVGRVSVSYPLLFLPPAMDTA